jgi:hypothetical protein
MTFDESNVNRDRAGKFDSKVNTEAEDGIVTPPTSGLDDVLYDRVRKAADFASRAEASAKHRRLLAETEYVRELIHRHVPNGTTAVFTHDWNDGGPHYRLAGVLDANSELLWDRYSADHTNRFSQDVHALLESVGGDAIGYFDGPADDPRVFDSESVVLDLTRPSEKLSAVVSTSPVELDRMTDDEAEDLTQVLTRHTGEIRTYQNRAAVLDLLRHLRADEAAAEEFDLPLNALSRLAEKFGNEEAAVNAIVKSSAWKRHAQWVADTAGGEIYGVIRDAAVQAGVNLD